MSQVDCKITYLRAVSDTLILRLQPSETLPFHAGQYLFMAIDGEHFKPYSIASIPSDEALEFHIRDNPEAPLITELARRYEAGQTIQVQTPTGNCTLQRASMLRPILFVAGGTGYAPCNAMIRELLVTDSRPAFALYWGVAYSNELYLNEELGLLASQQIGFTYVPVVQFPEDEADTTMRHGFVHEAVLESNLDLAEYDIYLSGSAAMVGHVHHALVAAGAQSEHIYSDMLDLNLAEFPADS
ncbi:MAG: FAD-binding oxidoreductase [Gammaproteobacteria bacterium]